MTRTSRLAVSLFTICLLGAAGTAPATLSKDAARRILQEHKACKLAIGLQPTGKDEVESRVICVAEIVRERDSINEDLGCSVVLYDLGAAAYRAGASNLKIATNRHCDAQALAELNPKPFVEYAAREKIAPVILHSDTPELEAWWTGHYTRELAERRTKDLAARRPQAGAKSQATTKQKAWSYDGKKQFDGN